MTIEELKAAVPKHQRGMITERIVNVFNQLESEEGEDFAEHYKQNFIGLSHILKSSNYSITDYINAVKFISYKLLENSDIDSYQMTFPERYARLLSKWQEEGMTEEEIRERKISPYVSAYKRNDIVKNLMEQALMPSRILNAPYFQQALNVQLDLMYNARSEMVKLGAAESVLKYTAPNESTKIELEVGVKGQDEVQALRDEMMRLASQQQLAIQSGINTSLEIAESKLLYEEVEEVIEVEEDNV